MSGPDITEKGDLNLPGVDLKTPVKQLVRRGGPRVIIGV
jgi:hypothetical protein